MSKFQAEIKPEQFDEIEKLMEKCNISSKKDLLLNAVAFLAWAVDEKMAGRMIASIDEAEGRYKEITMPLFRNLRA